MMQAPAWLDSKEASDYLNVGIRTIHKWTSERLIPSYAIGRVVRYQAKDLDKFMSEHRRAAV